MSLEGALFICLDETGNRGRIVKAKGRKFTVGYYESCDLVIDDDERVKGVHCTIESDAFGRVTISNLSAEHPIAINGEEVTNKRILFNKTTINILDKSYLWEFATKNAKEFEDVQCADVSTPQKQIGIPQQSAFSCPDVKHTQNIEPRFTVHNFAYCIQSDEEGNTSRESNEDNNDVSTPAEDVLNVSAKSDNNQDKQEEDNAKEQHEVMSGREEKCKAQETPKMNLINYTNNKENSASTHKKNHLQLSLCHQSDVVITSFSPRETGVRTEKSFTAILKPKVLVTRAPNTPKSVYSTPKSVLGDDDDDDEDEVDKSRNVINFHTPSTSKKDNARKNVKNTSMHLVDFTTPTKLAPPSPYLKSAQRASAKKLPITPSASIISKGKLATEDRLGVSALSITPKVSDDNKTTIETPNSVQSVISVDSTDTSSVIEILSDESTPGTNANIVLKTPGKCGPGKVTTTTPMRTPQSLMKRAILTSTKKQASTPQKPEIGQVTPRREPINRIPLRTSIGSLRTPATPTSMSTPSRKSMAAPRFESTPANNANVTNTPSSSRRSSLIPMSASRAQTSTPYGPSNQKRAACKTSPLKRVRKSVGGIPLSSHISKARRSIMPTTPSNYTSIKEKSPQQVMSDRLVARARKSMCVTPMVARAINMVQAAKTASPNIFKKQQQQQIGRKSLAPRSAVLFGEKQKEPIKSGSADLSRTFVVDLEDDEPQAMAGNSSEAKKKDATFSPKKEKTLNITFSPEKDKGDQNQDNTNQDSAPKCLEIPLDVEEVAQKEVEEQKSENAEVTNPNDRPIDDNKPLRTGTTEESFAEIIDLSQDEIAEEPPKSSIVEDVDKDIITSSVSGKPLESETGFGEESSIETHETQTTNGEKITAGVSEETKNPEVIEELAGDNLVKDDNNCPGLGEITENIPKQTSFVYKPICEDITLESSIIEKDAKDITVEMNESKKTTVDSDPVDNPHQSETVDIQEAEENQCLIASSDENVGEKIREVITEVLAKHQDINLSQEDKIIASEVPNVGETSEVEPNAVDQTEEAKTAQKDLNTNISKEENEHDVEESSEAVPEIAGQQKEEKSFAIQNSSVSINEETCKIVEEVSTSRPAKTSEESPIIPEDEKNNKNIEIDSEVSEPKSFDLEQPTNEEDINTLNGSSRIQEGATMDKGASLVHDINEAEIKLTDDADTSKLLEEIEDVLNKSDEIQQKHLEHHDNDVESIRTLTEENESEKLSQDSLLGSQQSEEISEENTKDKEVIPTNQESLETAEKTVSESQDSEAVTDNANQKASSPEPSTSVKDDKHYVPKSISKLLEATTSCSPKRRSRRTSMLAENSEDDKTETTGKSLQTVAKKLLETEAAEPLTPRRSTRRKSSTAEKDDESKNELRVLPTFTPRRRGRRASMSIESSDSVCTPSTKKTRRASLSAVSEAPLTPKRITRRRSSITLDADEVVKVMHDSMNSGETEAEGGVKFEEISEDMGAIIEEEEDEEQRDVQVPDSTVKQPQVNNITNVNLDEEHASLDIFNEGDAVKILIEENVCEIVNESTATPVIEAATDSEQNAEISGSDDAKEQPPTMVHDLTQGDDDDDAVVQDLTECTEEKDKDVVAVVSKSVQDLTQRDENVVSQIVDSSLQNVTQDDTNICQVVNNSVQDLTQDEENLNDKADSSVQDLSQDNEDVCQVLNASVQDLTQDEGNLNDKADSSVQDLTQDNEDVCQVLNASVQDLTQDEDNINKEAEISVQDLTQDEENFGQDISKDLSQPEVAEVVSSSKALNESAHDLIKDKESICPILRNDDEVDKAKTVESSEANVVYVEDKEDMQTLVVSDDESICEITEEIPAESIENVPKTPNVKKTVRISADSPKTPVMAGMRELLKTPKASEGTSKDLRGVKELLNTPKSTATPRFKGMRELMQTPKTSSTPVLGGVKELLDTPIQTQKSVKTNVVVLDESVEATVMEPTEEVDKHLGGVKELLQTPKSTATPRFKGMRELMQTPKTSATPILGGVKELLDTPMHTEKQGETAVVVLDDSIEATPVEPTKDADKNLGGVKELLKTPKPAATPTFKGMRELMQTPKISSTPGLGGVKELLDTPIQAQKQAELLDTPNQTQTEVVVLDQSIETTAVEPSKEVDSNLGGVKELLKTPKAMATPRFKGMRELMQTPKTSSTPTLGGVKELLDTPNQAQTEVVVLDQSIETTAVENFGGVKELLKTPKSIATPRFKGMRELMQTPKPSSTPVLGGVKELLDTPNQGQTEVVVLDQSIETTAVEPTKDVDSNLGGVKELLKTPKSMATPRFKGMRELMQTPKTSSTPVLGGVKELLDPSEQELQQPAEEEVVEQNEDIQFTPEAEREQSKKGDDECEEIYELDAEVPTTSSKDNPKELRGVKELLNTPKGCSTPRFKGMRELMQTPKVYSTPVLGGLKELMDTPKQKADERDFDKFLKTPTAKNIMIPTLPSSAIIEKNEDSVEMVHSTEYDLNASHEGGSTHLEELFKTPVASRFVERISDSLCEEGGEEGDNDKSDKQTPLRKSLPRKSLMLKTPHYQSPFSAAEVLTDLSKTDVEDWMEQVDPLQQTVQEDNEEVEANKTKADNSVINLDDSLTEKDKCSASLSVVPETCSKSVPNDMNTSEAMINVSAYVSSTTIKDPLSGSTTSKLKQLEKRPSTPIDTADISGINLLDQTGESVLDGSLVVSDDEGGDFNQTLNKTNEQHDVQNKTLCDDGNDLSEPLLVSDSEEVERDGENPQHLDETSEEKEFSKTESTSMITETAIENPGSGDGVENPQPSNEACEVEENTTKVSIAIVAENAIEKPISDDGAENPQPLNEASEEEEITTKATTVAENTTENLISEDDVEKPHPLNEASEVEEITTEVSTAAVAENAIEKPVTGDGVENPQPLNEAAEVSSSLVTENVLENPISGDIVEIESSLAGDRDEDVTTTQSEVKGDHSNQSTCEKEESETHLASPSKATNNEGTEEVQGDHNNESTSEKEESEAAPLASPSKAKNNEGDEAEIGSTQKTGGEPSNKLEKAHSTECEDIFLDDSLEETTPTPQSVNIVDETKTPAKTLARQSIQKPDNDIIELTSDESNDCKVIENADEEELSKKEIRKSASYECENIFMDDTSMSDISASQKSANDVVTTVTVESSSEDGNEITETNVDLDDRLKQTEVQEEINNKQENSTSEIIQEVDNVSSSTEVRAEDHKVICEEEVEEREVIETTVIREDTSEKVSEKGIDKEASIVEQTTINSSKLHQNVEAHAEVISIEDSDSCEEILTTTTKIGEVINVDQMDVSADGSVTSVAIKEIPDKEIQTTSREDVPIETTQRTESVSEEQGLEISSQSSDVISLSDVIPTDNLATPVCSGQDNQSSENIQEQKSADLEEKTAILPEEVNTDLIKTPETHKKSQGDDNNLETSIGVNLEDDSTETANAAVHNEIVDEISADLNSKSLDDLKDDKSTQVVSVAEVSTDSTANIEETNRITEKVESEIEAITEKPISIETEEKSSVENAAIVSECPQDGDTLKTAIPVKEPSADREVTSEDIEDTKTHDNVVDTNVCTTELVDEVSGTVNLLKPNEAKLGEEKDIEQSLSQASTESATTPRDQDIPIETTNVNKTINESERNAAETAPEISVAETVKTYDIEVTITDKPEFIAETPKIEKTSKRIRVRKGSQSSVCSNDSASELPKTKRTRRNTTESEKNIAKSEVATADLSIVTESEEKDIVSEVGVDVIVEKVVESETHERRASQELEVKEVASTLVTQENDQTKEVLSEDITEKKETEDTERTTDVEPKSEQIQVCAEIKVSAKRGSRKASQDSVHEEDVSKKTRRVGRRNIHKDDNIILEETSAATLESMTSPVQIPEPEERNEVEITTEEIESKEPPTKRSRRKDSQESPHKLNSRHQAHSNSKEDLALDKIEETSEMPVVESSESTETVRESEDHNDIENKLEEIVSEVKPHKRSRRKVSQESTPEDDAVHTHKPNSAGKALSNIPESSALDKIDEVEEVPVAASSEGEKEKKTEEIKSEGTVSKRSRRKGSQESSHEDDAVKPNSRRKALTNAEEGSALDKIEETEELSVIPSSSCEIRQQDENRNKTAKSESIEESEKSKEVENKSQEIESGEHHTKRSRRKPSQESTHQDNAAQTHKAGSRRKVHSNVEDAVLDKIEEAETVISAVIPEVQKPKAEEEINEQSESVDASKKTEKATQEEHKPVAKRSRRKASSDSVHSEDDDTTHTRRGGRRRVDKAPAVLGKIEENVEAGEEPSLETTETSKETKSQPTTQNLSNLDKTEEKSTEEVVKDNVSKETEKHDIKDAGTSEPSAQEVDISEEALKETGDKHPETQESKGRANKRSRRKASQETSLDSTTPKAPSGDGSSLDKIEECEEKSQADVPSTETEKQDHDTEVIKGRATKRSRRKPSQESSHEVAKPPLPADNLNTIDETEATSTEPIPISVVDIADVPSAPLNKETNVLEVSKETVEHNNDSEVVKGRATKRSRRKAEHNLEDVNTEVDAISHGSEQDNEINSDLAVVEEITEPPAIRNRRKASQDTAHGVEKLVKHTRKVRHVPAKEENTDADKKEATATLQQPEELEEHDKDEQEPQVETSATDEEASAVPVPVEKATGDVEHLDVDMPEEQTEDKSKKLSKRRGATAQKQDQDKHDEKPTVRSRRGRKAHDVDEEPIQNTIEVKPNTEVEIVSDNTEPHAVEEKPKTTRGTTRNTRKRHDSEHVEGDVVHEDQEDNNATSKKKPNAKKTSASRKRVASHKKDTHEEDHDSHEADISHEDTPENTKKVVNSRKKDDHEHVVSHEDNTAELHTLDEAKTGRGGRKAGEESKDVQVTISDEGAHQPATTSHNLENAAEAHIPEEVVKGRGRRKRGDHEQEASHEENTAAKTPHSLDNTAEVHLPEEAKKGRGRRKAGEATKEVQVTTSEETADQCVTTSHSLENTGEIHAPEEVKKGRGRRKRDEQDAVHEENTAGTTSHSTDNTAEAHAPEDVKKGRGRRKRDDHEHDISHEENTVEEAKKGRARRKKGEEHKEAPVTTAEEQIDHSPTTSHSLETKSRSRKRKESQTEQQQAPTEVEVVSPETPKRSQPSNDANNQTPDSERRARNVPQRRVATVHHNYDETSDSEKPEKKKKKTESSRKSLEAPKPANEEAMKSADSSSDPSPASVTPATTARGRTRKPTAKVQKFLEEERAKAETPRKRGVVLEGSAVDTPTKSQGVKRGAKSAVPDAQVVGTPQTSKRVRGKVVAESKEDNEQTNSESHIAESEPSTPPHATVAPKGRKGARKGKSANTEHVEATDEPPAKKSPQELIAEKEEIPVATPESVEDGTPARTTGKRNAAAAAKARIEEDALAAAADAPKKTSRAKRVPAKAAVSPAKREHRLASASTVEGVEDLEPVEEDSHTKEEPKTATKRAPRKATATSSATDSPAVPAKRSRKAKTETETETKADDIDEPKTSRAAARSRKNVHFASGQQSVETPQEEAPQVAEETPAVAPAAATTKRATRVRRK